MTSFSFVKSVCIIIILTVISSACRRESPETRPGQPKPGSARFLANEGLICLNNGDLPNARQRFQAAITKDPNLADAHFGLAIVLLNNREFNPSLNAFQRTKQLSPDNYDVYNYMGIIYIELQQFDRAREHLLVAATSDKYQSPENAYANLALLEMKQKNPEGALRYINKGLERKRGFSPLLNLEGAALEAQGKFEDALYSYERASKSLFDQDVNILLSIARINVILKQADKALDVLEKAFSKTQNQVEREAVQAMIAEINKNR